MSLILVVTERTLRDVYDTYLIGTVGSDKVIQSARVDNVQATNGSGWRSIRMNPVNK
jgi:hypothetical protein